MLVLDSESFITVILYCTICNNHFTSILLSLYYRWEPCVLAKLIRHNDNENTCPFASSALEMVQNKRLSCSRSLPTVAVAYSSQTSFLQYHSYLFVKEGYTTTLFTNRPTGRLWMLNILDPLYDVWCQKFPEQWKTVYSGFVDYVMMDTHRQRNHKEGRGEVWCPPSTTALLHHVAHVTNMKSSLH